MSESNRPSRRDFLRTTAGGLVVGASLSTAGCAANPFGKPRAADELNWGNQSPGSGSLFDIWLRISPDNTITIYVPSSEMGQGVLTSLPMLLADELDVDWKSVRMEMAPVHSAYRKKTHYGSFNMTAESRSIRACAPVLRQTGAAARQMLTEAAASSWQVDPTTCKTENGIVEHPPSGRRATYGELAAAAAKLSAPSDPPLKKPSDYRYIGKSVARVDLPSKVDGSATFGLDVRIPNMLFAAIDMCPVFGGTLESVDESKLQGLRGIDSVVKLDNGVAVVADTYWRARKGLDALTITYDEGDDNQFNSSDVDRMLTEHIDDEAPTTFSCGDIDDALEEADKVIEAEYDVPFITHATLEPMNCTAYVTDERCEVWVPTQTQEWTEDRLASVTGHSRSNIYIHTTLLGGGLGRRLETDFVAQAAEISMACGKPVQLIWTRENDTQHGFYRPAFRGKIRGSIDKEGNLTGLRHRNVGQFILQNFAPGFVIDIVRRFPNWLNQDIDELAQQGAINRGYHIPNQEISFVRTECPVPIGNHRAVGHVHNAFCTESFLDEAAHAAKQDPVAFRKRLLAQSPRYLAVMERAAKEANWGNPPEGHYQGLAVHGAFGSFTCQIAEVSVSDDGKLKVHRVTCAVDCGMVVHPDTVKSQMEGGLAFGLSGALGEAITLKDGRVEQTNFVDYPLLHMADMPSVDVHIVDNPTAEPGGIGEAGVPAIAPAVTNAIFAATGKRIRSLPIRLHDLKKG